MFCPKCGTQNAENVRFCRSCGIELEVISAALTGNLRLPEKSSRRSRRAERHKTPEDVMEEAVRNFFLGGAFIVIAILLTVTGYIGGNTWGFWLLIPGGTIFGSGVANYMRAKRLQSKRSELNSPMLNPNLPPVQNANSSLPPPQTLFTNDYMPPVPNTGELVTPTSVTEGTTRHLTHETEDKTRALPQG